jgi:hypothetical protein
MKQKLILIIFLLGIIFITGCAQKVPKDEPAWVQELIQKAIDAPAANPGVEIYKCVYQGQTAYYFPPQCCDQFGGLIAENGTGICAPDGGYSGRGDGMCPAPFSMESSQCKLIWRDPRSRKIN